MNLNEIELKNKDIAIPANIVSIWQQIADTIATMLGVPSAMINRLESPYLDVFRSNISASNPFPSGTRMPMAGIYCESAAKRRRPVQVTDARIDPEWSNSPTAKAGIYAYLGYPLLWPDGEVFGTLCVVDTKENHWGEMPESLLQVFKDAVEKHLALARALAELDQKNHELANALTAKEQSEALLASERQRLANILEGTSAGSMEWNIQTGEITVNERFAEILGRSLQELLPCTLTKIQSLIHPDDLSEVTALYEEIVTERASHYDGEARMLRKDGTYVWTLLRGKVMTRSADGKPLVMCGVQLDITERKQAEEKIRHMATHDTLTGPPSLALARDRLKMALSFAIRHEAAAAVMFIDLDNFKMVNDTFGHDAGDYVLKQVARRMRENLRQSDTVARVGGDEFMLIASGLRSQQDAAQIARKLIATIATPVSYQDHAVVVGASIGIVMFPKYSQNIDTLIKAADQAMYRIKNSGKNAFAFACEPEAD